MCVATRQRYGNFGIKALVNKKESLEMLILKAFSQLIHCLTKYTPCLTRILQSIVPFSLAQHATTRRASGFVHLCPMLLGQFEPVQWPFVLHCSAVETSIVKRRVVNHTLLKHAEALLPPPKFCSSFQHLCQLLVSGERTLLCRVCLCSWYMD